MDVTEARYGTWSSPVTPSHAAHSIFRLGQIAVDGADVYWTDDRSEEDGRVALLRLRPGSGGAEDICPPGLSVRSRVYEYGGGSFTVTRGVVCFVNDADQVIYRLDGGRPVAVTSAGSGDVRHGDLAFDPARERLVCVTETHRAGGPPVHAITAYPLDPRLPPQVLATGRDFYCAPRPAPDHRRLCWIEWSHPRMPWDGTELWLAELDRRGRPVSPVRVAGGLAESVLQPQWGPDGLLYWVSDRSGWWNVWRLRDGRAEPVTTESVDFGRPQWVLHLISFAFLDAGTIAAAGARQGVWSLYVIDVASGALRELPTRFTECGSVVRARQGRAVLDAASPTELRAVVEVDPAGADVAVLGRAQAVADIDTAYLSPPEHITFTSEGRPTCGIFYPPRNPRYRPPAGELPPLLVRAHGGPTAAAGTMLDYAVQYWTTRGIAVLDVDYGGSSGYGREYRERLRGQWGELDAADCCAGALHLVRRGSVDGARLLIQGNSAGGLTVLNALARHATFHAGTCYYGIADLEVFTRDTHKFESRYCDGLVGSYPAERARYRERSPIHAAQDIHVPLLMFQGLDDPVVPAGQAEAMFEAVRRNGVPCAYLAFPGEQHGFRIAENIHRCIEAEEYFYGRVFGFLGPRTDPPIRIDHLDSAGRPR